MTRLLVVEPGYCPYQAGFSNTAIAISEVIEGESQILKPFGTPRIGLVCSKYQNRLKYNRQINDEGVTVRGRFLVCGLNGDKVVGLSKDQADRYSRLLFLPQVEDMASDELPAAKVRPQDERYGGKLSFWGKVGTIMGYQESWIYIEPQWNFKKLLRAYEQAEAAGYYELFGAEPLSVIILKRPFGKIPAGKKLLWVCGDRCFHNVSGIFGRNLNILGRLQIIPIEAVLDMNDSRLEGINFENSTPSENPYMKRYSVVDYAHRMKQAQSKSNPER